MPDLSPTSFAIPVLLLIAGILIGWLLRNARSRAEKAAINAGWQAQMDATRTEHRRLSEQNKSLMEQVNQLQATARDAGSRTRELVTALEEANGRRDELQRDIKVVRNNLENAVGEKHRLKSDLSVKEASVASAADALREKEARIQNLKKELENWRDRLPPLIERFRERDAEAKRLEALLREANDRATGMEAVFDPTETHVGPLAADELLDSVDASNEIIDEPASVDEVDDESPQDEPECSTNGHDIERLTDVDATGEAPRDDPAANMDRASITPSSGGLRDNLQAISGVGPAIEKTLNELGIFRYAQVAEMTSYDVERITNRLQGFHGRIEREDWIGQARLLNERRSESDNVESQQGDL